MNYEFQSYLIQEKKLSVLREFYSLTYWNISIFMVLTVLLTGIMLFLAYILSLNTIKSKNQLSEYECGFEPFDNATRSPFEIHFYIVGILFLIFDVEIAMLFPWILGLNYIGSLGFYTTLFFIWLLSLGFFYEWHIGALNWSKSGNSFVKSFLVLTINMELTNNFVENRVVDIEKNIYSYSFLIEQLKIFWGNCDKTILNFDLPSTIDLDYSLQDIFVSYLIIMGIVIISSSMFQKKASFLTKKQVVVPCLKDISIIGFWIGILNFVFFFIFEFFSISDLIILANSYVVSDQYILILKILILISISFLLLSSKNYMIFHESTLIEFPLLISFTSLFLIILVSSFNLMIVFVSLLGASIIIYSALGIDKQNHSSREATMKYFLLSALSTGLLGFSIVNFLLIFLTSNFFILNSSLSLWFSWSTSYFLSHFSSTIWALSFLILAVFFKLSAFPGHLWVVDIYQGSSNPMMGFFIMPMKVAVFGIFAKIVSWVFDSLKTIWGILLWTSTILSMIWGCFGALIEQNLKKLLAYSSINQIGFLLSGVACLSFSSFKASFIYLLIYIVTNIALFAVFLNSKQNLTHFKISHINDLNKFAINNFKSSGIITLTMLSMAGIPPLAGFFGKFFLFFHAFEENYLSLVVIGMLTSLISTFYYLNIINKMWFLKLPCISYYTSISTPMVNFLSLLTTFIILFFIFIDLWGSNLILLLSLKGYMFY